MIMKEKKEFEYSVSLEIYPGYVTEYCITLFLGRFPSFRTADDRATKIVKLNQQHLIIPKITKIQII